MKCTIPEISWHNRDPVLSIDIQPVVNDGVYRLASGGADCHLLIWHLKVLQSDVSVDMVSDLTRHQKAVNAVRWSPSGQLLASGDDDACIIIWKLKTDNIPLLEGESADKEIWLINKILRGHREDVYDINWSPDGLKLVSGSIDNTAIIWDVVKGKMENILSDHKGFIQGVAWDPKDQYIATICSDRVCRIFDSTGKNVKSRTCKGLLPVTESHSLYNKEVKYFHDDMFKSYFRRLTFSCDGNLIFVPSGCIDLDNSKTLQTTYVFTLERLTSPVAILPSPKQITIATRCCPILFKLHNDGPDPLIDLPYRMVVAVGTDRDVILYDTQQLLPMAHFNRIHYTRITDLTWSSDGQLLLVSSTDGFCTLITFEKEELGIAYVTEEIQEQIVVNVSDVEEQENPKVAKKPNILEQWALKATKDIDSSSEKKPTPLPVRKEPKRATLTKIGDIAKKCKLNNYGHITNNSRTAQVTVKQTSLESVPVAKDIDIGNKYDASEFSQKALNGYIYKTKVTDDIIIIDDSPLMNFEVCNDEKIEMDKIQSEAKSKSNISELNQEIQNQTFTRTNNKTIEENSITTGTNIVNKSEITELVQEIESGDLGNTQIDGTKIKVTNNESSPVKLEISSNSKCVKNLDKTPVSISNGCSSSSRSGSSRKCKTQLKGALLKNSTLFKFLQRDSVKSAKTSKAATIRNKINRNDKAIDQPTNPVVISERDTILIEDSNDGLTLESVTIPSEKANSNLVTISKEQGHVDLHLNTTNVDTDKSNDNTLSNLSGNQSLTSKVLVKPGRRIQLVTLSSPKRKKNV